jgi:hypothetical protein
MEARLQLTFQPMWPNVRKIRQEVTTALGAYSRELRSAAVMTAAELVENAIKYGESVPAAESVSFLLQTNPGQLRIRVVNGSTNLAGVAELARRVNELTRAADKQALYLTRLEELLADGDQTGKLGVYRIGFEGAFDLECDYRDSVVTVTATRDVDV